MDCLKIHGNTGLKYRKDNVFSKAGTLKAFSKSSCLVVDTLPHLWKMCDTISSIPFGYVHDFTPYCHYNLITHLELEAL
jgi:hypothetical protein